MNRTIELMAASCVQDAQLAERQASQEKIDNPEDWNKNSDRIFKVSLMNLASND